MSKDKEYCRLIHTAKWMRLRRDVLTRHPVCQRCEAEGIMTPATEVHHIRPVEEAITYGDKIQRMYDPHNLQALCHDCHVKVHTELGRCGRAATMKRNAEHVKQIVNKFFLEQPTKDPGVDFLSGGAPG